MVIAMGVGVIWGLRLEQKFFIIKLQSVKFVSES